MEISFIGKRALVTGAGKGIGKAIAIRLAECGAEVVAISRTQSDLDDLRSINDKIQTVFLDIGDWERTKSVIQDIGSIDLLVNNAAVIDMKELGTIVEEDIDRLYNINVKAVINITQVIAERMKERGKGGSIVNVSSICGFQAGPFLSVYSSTKAALDQLTRCMALEYGPYQIRVNSVNPTGVRTQMAAELFEALENGNTDSYDIFRRTPLRRLGEVDDIAYPVLFLLSDKATLISGVTLPIDGGVTACF